MAMHLKQIAPNDEHLSFSGPEANALLRRRIQKQTADFLRNGGVIQEIPRGVSVEHQYCVEIAHKLKKQLARRGYTSFCIGKGGLLNEQ